MPELNFVSTNATDTAGASGLVQQPYLATATPGYNYGGAGNPTGDGFMEYGAGTATALPFRVDQAGNVTAASFATGAPGSAAATLAKVAATAAAGHALVNGTGSFLTWTAPNDGSNHRALLFLQSFASSGVAGGQVNVTATDPAGNAVNLTALSNNPSAGPHTPGLTTVILEAGTTVSIVQQTALTAGTVTVWAEIWGA